MPTNEMNIYMGLINHFYCKFFISCALLAYICHVYVTNREPKSVNSISAVNITIIIVIIIFNYDLYFLSCLYSLQTRRK